MAEIERFGGNKFKHVTFAGLNRLDSRSLRREMLGPDNASRDLNVTLGELRRGELSVPKRLHMLFFHREKSILKLDPKTFPRVSASLRIHP